MILSAGNRVGPYDILEPLGSGGMGEVYRARDVRLDRVIALKLLARRFSIDSEARARFEREARLASSLNHPNIIVVHDIGEFNGLPYIAMECVEGDTLFGRIGRRPMPVSTVVDIAAQIADGLARAHAAGVIHRDLKPSNVMITPDGRVKVLDFGLGKQVEEQVANETTWPGHATSPGVLLGTASYMSPEQVQGRALDFRSDQFSLGLMLYEMLAGKHAFERPSSIQTMAAIIGDEAPSIASVNTKVPEALGHVMDRCLAKDPGARFDSTADLARALRDIGDHLRSGRLLAPISTRHVRRWSWSTPTAVAVAGAAALVAVIVWIAGGGLALPDNRQIAVLPFANVGGEPEVQALSDGLVEVLTTRLTQMERFSGGLFVVPASEVRAQRVDSPSAARKAFGVNLVVSGSVQRSNGRLLVTLNLVDPESLRQLRADTLDLPLTDAVALQDDVTLRVAGLLDLSLPADARAQILAGGTNAPGAVEYYLQGRGYLQRYERSENVDLALSLFERAIAADPSYALAHAAIAETLLRKYQGSRDTTVWERAQAEIKAATDASPGLPAARLTSAMIATASGRYEEAAAALQRLLADDPTNADAHRELGLAYEALGDVVRAEAAFKQAVSARPNDWSSYNHLGAFYNRRQKLAEAAEQFERVVALTPDNVRGYSNLGATYIRLRQWDRAIAAFERSIAISPTFAAWSNLGTTYFRQSRYEDSVGAYERALALNAKDHRVWYNLASASLRVPGRNQQTRDAFAKAAELGEQDRKINPRQPLLLARLASCYAHLGDRGRALPLARDAETLGREDPGVLLLLAEVYEDLGDRTSALARVSDALARGMPLSEIESNRTLDALRKDPSFNRLAQPATR